MRSGRSSRTKVSSDWIAILDAEYCSTISSGKPKSTRSSYDDVVESKRVRLRDAEDSR